MGWWTMFLIVTGDCLHMKSSKKGLSHLKMIMVIYGEGNFFV